MHRVDQSVELFRGGYTCSQAILMTYGQSLGLRGDQACRLAAGFSGGLRMGETCGAVTGAIMVLGLALGDSNPQDQQAKARTYAAVVEFEKRFAAQAGSTCCRDLLGLDVREPEQLAKARETGLFKTLCPRFVETSARILESIMAETPADNCPP
ncbi:MAG TPA: C-GCAxxG-C-C family protein [Candidatus Paceibacterota bacterium]|nr:C-GCAxxG-C-C family protein [Verrucomicrobiota bacterium]HRY47126.1 C-GCAxxG-C-C family protein [Candidatus Paceibacterota bacterium]HSA00565.1 C-GCAxxG-C-C family protein [Candidatus Paceibacterota bacterium]